MSDKLIDRLLVDKDYAGLKEDFINIIGKKIANRIEEKKAEVVAKFNGKIFEAKDEDLEDNDEDFEDNDEDFEDNEDDEDDDDDEEEEEENKKDKKKKKKMRKINF